MEKNTLTEDEKAIRVLIDTWLTATKAGDISTVLDLMSKDVVFLVPGREPFGKGTFQKTAEEMKSGEEGGVHYEGESEIQEIKIFDEWAYATTRLEVNTIPIDGEPAKRSGYTLSIFRKEADGQWRLARDANLLVND